jgi:hypothetical protein
VVKWIGIGLGAAAVAIAGYWVLARSGAAPAPAPITVAAPTQTFVAPSPVPVTDGAANGCLGGPGSDPAAVVLAAQQAATLTPEGAAGFALAFLRYQGTSPGDLQLSTTLPRIVHPGWLPEVSGPFAKHSADLAALGGVSGTVPGAADTWRIVAADPAGASISVGFVIYLGQHSAPNMVQSTGVLILDVTDGHWVVAGAAPPPADPTAPIDGAPWQSYAGVC